MDVSGCRVLLLLSVTIGGVAARCLKKHVAACDRGILKMECPAWQQFTDISDNQGKHDHFCNNLPAAERCANRLVCKCSEKGYMAYKKLSNRISAFKSVCALDADGTDFDNFLNMVTPLSNPAACPNNMKDFLQAQEALLKKCVGYSQMVAGYRQNVITQTGASPAVVAPFMTFVEKSWMCDPAERPCPKKRRCKKWTFRRRHPGLCGWGQLSCSSRVRLSGKPKAKLCRKRSFRKRCRRFCG